MATRDDIQSWLVSDLPARIKAAAENPGAYRGQVERINPDDFDLRVQYGTREKLRRRSGQTRHRLTIHVMSRGWDLSAEVELADKVDQAAELIVDGYDGKKSTVQAGLTAVQVERVRCFRVGEMDVPEGRKPKRGIEITFELDEFEE